MAKRSIVWTKTANFQLHEVLKYWVIRNKSSRYSKKLLKAVTKRVLQISETPYIYKLTDYNDVRVSSMGDFSIFYKATDKQIIIMSFWDNRQDSKKILKLLRNK